MITDWPEDNRAGKSKPPAQKDMLALAARRVLAVTDTSLAPWIAELSNPHITASGEKADYTRLEAHLRRYTARNTFDYFIHKDLGGFLRRELDFYIKNEVMHLDDVENETALRVEQYLSKIKVIRKIAGKIIDFLAQIEDFQKKLWLKKKFVVETRYCITLGCIPDAFYAEIAANDAQHEEWVKLYAINEIKGDLTTPGYSKKLKSGFMKAHPTLVVDTRHFDVGFTARLLEAIGDVDAQTDGVLFHSENFQALRFLLNRNRGSIDLIYIDPPYNTDATEIIYKNGYKESSWLALIASRLSLGRSLLCAHGVHCLTIDDYEHAKARLLLDDEFRSENYLATVSIRNNPSGRSTVKGFSVNHEFALFYGIDTSSTRVGRLPHSAEQKCRYDVKDDDGAFEWENFRKSSAGSDRASRPKQHFPLYVDEETLSIRIPQVKWVDAMKSYEVLEEAKQKEVIVWPVDESGTKKVWRWGIERTHSELSLLEARANYRIEVYGRKYLNERGVLPRTWWDKSEYSARDNGTRVLRDLFLADVGFDFPKAVAAVKDSIRIGCPKEDGTVLDYFGGSATTGHAVIELNRENNAQRRFVLAEMGKHFDTVLLPRIKKVTFTPEWKDGKPKRLASPEEAERSPRIVRVVRLESYEDTLNNLETRRTLTQQSLLLAPEAQGADGFKEQYLLRYMLNVETRGSQSLLNVQAFTDPTAYKLKVKRPGSDESREVNVDLLETFNWLIGLTVRKIAAPRRFSAAFERDSEKRLRLKGLLKQVDPSADLHLKGEGETMWWFRTVSGTTPDGRKALIIWRNLTGDPEQDNLVLDAWFGMQGYLAEDSELDLIYVNGGNNLENLKAPGQTWKVRLIEADFQRLMFEMENT